METETVTPIGTPYADALTAFDEAQAALAASPTAALLRHAYHLTHRLGIETGPLMRDLRQQRDMIDAEILRRADR